MREFRLQSIMAEHKKPITAISWSPFNSDVIATSGKDNRIIVWNVVDKTIIGEANYNSPCSLSWGLPDKKSLVFVCPKGPLCMWNCSSSGTVVFHKEVRNFSSDICQVRCHPENPEKIALGHADGSISLFGIEGSL